MKQTLKIYWCTIDNVYFAEAVDLKGCIVDGATYQEALEKLLDIIPDWLKLAGEPTKGKG